MKNAIITVIFAATILIAGSSSSVAQTQERTIVTKANSIMLPAQLMTPEQVEISSLKKANATLTQKNTELEQRIANLDGKNWEYMTEISPLGRILVQTHWIQMT
jgi:cell division protein FtsB